MSVNDVSNFWNAISTIGQVKVADSASARGERWQH
jgi:hypothetical protein